MTRLDVHTVNKPWGRVVLPPPFANPGAEPVGEIWFAPPEDLSTLLLKYIFTSEKLSVQCHPSGAHAEAMGLGRCGKDECWYIVDAAPDARIAIGFTKSVDIETLRSAATDGSIEDLLVWHPVVAGDFFYIPAGTVHAIGAGISLIEVQQNSDITFRLYDYGRPRALHLDKSLIVATRGPYPAHLRQRVPARGHLALVDGPHFRLDRLDGPPAAAQLERYDAPALLLPLAGDVEVEGEVLRPGQCARVDRLADAEFAPDALCLVARPLKDARNNG